MLFWPDAALRSHSRGSVLSSLTRNERVLTSIAAADGQFLDPAIILFPVVSVRPAIIGSINALCLDIRRRVLVVTSPVCRR